MEIPLRLSLVDVIKQSADTYKAAIQPALYIIAFTFVFPQLVCGIYQDVQAADFVEKLRMDWEVSTATDFLVQLSAAGHHLLTVQLLPYVVLFAAFVVGYFALIHLQVAVHRGTPISAAEAVRAGFRSTLPRGAILAVLIGILIIFGQALVVMFLPLMALGLMVPVVFIVERGGMFASLWQALTLKYAAKTGFSAWNIVFTLLTVTGLFYFAMLFVDLGVEMGLFADQWLKIKRDLWMERGSYLVISVFEAILTALIISALPAVTTTMYFRIVSPRQIDLA